MPLAAFAPAKADVPKRARFTRQQVTRMMDTGVFVGQRFELIDGELIDKMGQNPPHASAIAAVAEILAELFSMRRVRVQLPIEVSGVDHDWSEPEPDVSVLGEGLTNKEFRSRHPNARDLALVVEIADTSAQYDSTRKRDLYARAGVSEYWVLDISRGVLHVYRNPSASGQFAETKTLSRKQSVEIGGLKLAVADMLPPPQK